jgi:hypothetical protein
MIAKVSPVHASGESHESHAEARGRLLAELQRYSGWLAKDHASVAVRTSVRELEAAIGAGSETSPSLQVLARDIDRLPSGDIRKMLRRALRQMLTELSPGGTKHEEGDHS